MACRFLKTAAIFGGPINRSQTVNLRRTPTYINGFLAVEDDGQVAAVVPAQSHIVGLRPSAFDQAQKAHQMPLPQVVGRYPEQHGRA